MVLRDHDPFDEETVREIVQQSRGTDGVILTEKDWVKVGRQTELLQGLKVWWPQVGIEMIEGESLLREAARLVFDRVSVRKT